MLKSSSRKLEVMIAHILAKTQKGCSIKSNVKVVLTKTKVAANSARKFVVTIIRIWCKT